MKSTSIALAWMIIVATIATFALAINKNITPNAIIGAINDINKEIGESVEESVEIIAHTLYHQTISPLVTHQVASSLIRGISELECEVSENANYNYRISYPIKKRHSLDGRFEMWVAANVHTSVIIDISEMNIDIDTENNRMEITLPVAYLDEPRVVDFQSSIIECSHLNNEESSSLVAVTFYQHLQNARSLARESAANSTIIEDVQASFTEQVAVILSNIYPGIEVIVVFTEVNEVPINAEFNEQS